MMMLFGGFMEVSAQASETARVQINHEKRLAKSKIRIRFLELIEDSRCPRDVQCIHAGNAKIKVRASLNGRSQELELDTNGANKTTTIGRYELKLVGLTPEPRSNIRINRNGYVATISVARIRK